MSPFDTARENIGSFASSACDALLPHRSGGRRPRGCLAFAALRRVSAVLTLIRSTGIALIRNGGGRLDFPDETSVGNEKLDRDGSRDRFLFCPLIQIKPAHTLDCRTCFRKLGRSSPQDPAKIRDQWASLSSNGVKCTKA